MKRLVIVSNRLPFNVKEREGQLEFNESTGGLVTGLSGFLRSLKNSSGSIRSYRWVGWPGGTVSDQFREVLKERSGREFCSHPVFLTEEEMDQFYLGFCNKTIWPLFHYFTSYTVYREDFWERYKHVNQVFANALQDVLQPDDVVWVHDYHLMLLPQLIKSRSPGVPIGFFLHTPFPSFEIFRLLPAQWRREILEGLMGADLVGFHTYEYSQHFLQSVLRILGFEHQMGEIQTPDRVVRAESFPMGIDFESFARAVDRPDVRAEVDEQRRILSNAKVVLSVDRLDYTKGILNRLQGFEILLESYPEYRGKVVLVMVVVPSRIGVEHYEMMKKQIEELVGKINGKFGSISWTPIVYQYRLVPFSPLVALYTLSDVGLVTPFRDGMNLVAKEYIAARTDSTGVLVLSEMAGAAKELGEAIIVNPNNIREIAQALREALEMPQDEQRRRNGIMRARIARYDVLRWATDFINGLLGAQGEQTKFSAKFVTESIRARIVADSRRSSRRAFFLDYDGTLAPFARHPALARPSPEVLNVLTQLTNNRQNAVTMISGRDKRTLEDWFRPLPLRLVAEHGIWVKESDVDWKLFKQLDSSWKANILPIFEQYADRLPGAFVEQKEHSIVWHYRAADPEHSESVASELVDHLTTFTANVDVQVSRGNKIVEMRPAGVNKGSVVHSFMKDTVFDFVFSIGDDTTDEDVFRILPETAYSIKVGIANTRARYIVQSVQAAVGLVKALAENDGEQ